MEVKILNAKQVEAAERNGNYPYRFDSGNTGLQSRVVDVEGRQEWAMPTGVVLVNGPSCADCWDEYEDNHGGLHYIR